ncbi:hypothetical protein HDU97_000154 [Phlyctochytrium planicorne]|nr:hypothetical protein HDU97_000154 [Phlyctochytrium planicorne]
MRFKNRYLLVEIIFADSQILESLHPGNIINTIRDSVEVNFGDVGVGSISQSFSVKYFSPYTSVAIVRVARDHVKLLWAAISFVSQIKGRKCLLRVVHVGGTIKQVQKQAIEFDKQQLLDVMRENRMDENKVYTLIAKSKKDIEALET